MLKNVPDPEPKKLPTAADLSYCAIQDAISILGKDERAFWSILVPSQGLGTAHELAPCFGMYVELSTWMQPDAWRLTKHEVGTKDGVFEKKDTSVGSNGA